MGLKKKKKQLTFIAKVWSTVWCFLYQRMASPTDKIYKSAKFMDKNASYKLCLEELWLLCVKLPQKWIATAKTMKKFR